MPISRAEILRDFRNQLMEVEADVLDIGRRIQEGDELWRGDRSMGLFINAATGKYEVLALDARGEPYVVLESDTCDQRILMSLAESDWQQGSRGMIERLVAREKAAARDRERSLADISGEIADKTAWAIRKAFAGHLGGRTSTYSFHTAGSR